MKSAPLHAKPAGGLSQAGLHPVLGYRVAQAAIVTQGLYERIVGQPLELRSVEFSILALVAENPGCSPAQLAHELALARPQVTLLVDRLTSRGLLGREPNPIDRRGRRLQVSEAGATLSGEATRRLMEAEQEALSHLSEIEHMMLIELLRKVALGRR
ncbi:MarR family transcriptional regulator [Xylophilus sp. Kf1]|nr:MarR family transcriptional regulator [Xylophilus sp. Kf1]